MGIGAAIYLEEYTGRSRLNHIIQTNIDNLAGVPSIIYGILGLAVFVRFFVQATSGATIGLSDPATASGRTILSAGLTLGLLILPLIIIRRRKRFAPCRSPCARRHRPGGHEVAGHLVPRPAGGAPRDPDRYDPRRLRAAGETAPLIVGAPPRSSPPIQRGRLPSSRSCPCRSTSGLAPPGGIQAPCRRRQHRADSPGLRPERRGDLYAQSVQ